MTTLEHAMVGANLVLGSGLHRSWGWQLVALGGFCALLPDWDGLTILWSVPLFDTAHRVWGHALLPCFVITTIFALLDYRCDFMTRCARFFVRWSKVKIPAIEERPELLQLRKTFPFRGICVWMIVGIVAACSHLLADLVVSGTATLADWELKLFWPFSDRGFVYPLVPWGDVGNMLILILGMFAMLRWKNHVQSIAVCSLLGVVGYSLIRNAF